MEKQPLQEAGISSKNINVRYHIIKLNLHSTNTSERIFIVFTVAEFLKILGVHTIQR